MRKNKLLFLIIFSFGFLESALAERQYRSRVDSWAYNEIVNTCQSGQAAHFYSQSVFEALRAAGELVMVETKDILITEASAFDLKLFSSQAVSWMRSMIVLVQIKSKKTRMSQK